MALGVSDRFCRGGALRMCFVLECFGFMVSRGGAKEVWGSFQSSTFFLASGCCGASIFIRRIQGTEGELEGCCLRLSGLSSFDVIAGRSK